MSLLAAFRALDDTNYLNEAATNFPNNPQVELAVLAHDEFPADRRKWLDLFKASSPSNSLANYLSAQDYFQKREYRTQPSRNFWRHRANRNLKIMPYESESAGSRIGPIFWRIAARSQPDRAGGLRRRRFAGIGDAQATGSRHCRFAAAANLDSGRQCFRCRILPKWECDSRKSTRTAATAANYLINQLVGIADRVHRVASVGSQYQLRFSWRTNSQPGDCSS